MAKDSNRPYRNAILTHLSPASLDKMRRHLQPIELKVRQVICAARRPNQHAYFVETGMISVVSVMEGGRSIEVGTIGHEGMTGAMLLLGTDRIPYECFVQIAGQAHRIEAKILCAEAKKNDDLREVDIALRSGVRGASHADGGV